MNENNEKIVRALECLMSVISEWNWSAGWMHGIEYCLWDLLQYDDLDMHGFTVTAAEKKDLKVLSDLCNGWVYWDENDGEVKFIGMAEWLKRYDAWKKPGWHD